MNSINESGNEQDPRNNSDQVFDEHPGGTGNVSDEDDYVPSSGSDHGLSSEEGAFYVIW